MTLATTSSPFFAFLALMPFVSSTGRTLPGAILEAAPAGAEAALRAVAAGGAGGPVDPCCSEGMLPLVGGCGVCARSVAHIKPMAKTINMDRRIWLSPAKRRNWLSRG